MQPDYDLVVIGSGPAGEKAAACAAYHGKRVVIVERSARPGGTMVAGVAVSKTMREAALYLTSFRRREVYGVGLDLDSELAVEGVRGRAKQVEQLLTEAVEQNIAQHGVDLVHGTGRLDWSRDVHVTPADGGAEFVLKATAVILATGSRPYHPPAIPFDHPDVLDSDTASLLDRPVRSMTVVGAGAVACEYASIFAALGTEVTLVAGRDRLLPFLDAEIADQLTEAFRAMGMRVILGTARPAVTTGDDGVVVTLPGGELLRPEKVIVAAGRVGNTENLGLDDAAVTTDERGLVQVNEHYATSAAGVYAAGDVTGPPALASVSMEQGRVAASHAFGLPMHDAVDAVPPFGVYSIPEAALVGLTESAAREAGHDVEVGRARLSRNARVAISGAEGGLVKLVFDRGDKRVLGAHVLGDNATELVHLPQAVMHANGTLDYFIHATYNVPTASEAFKYAAYDGLSRLGGRPTLTANA